MDTAEFFNLVLPEDGLLCLAIPYPTGKGYKHLFFDDVDKMARKVHQIDARGITVYHAMAGFQDDQSRTQANVARLRAFWLDVDVADADPRKYPTFRDAVRAVLTFARTVGLPQPYIVKSGRGAHVYWPLDADTTPDLWRPVASMLKAAAQVVGLMADPSRTADHASVLRPIGTTHRKAEPKPVELKLLGVTVQLTAFEDALFNYLEVNGGVPDTAADDFQIAGASVASMFSGATNSDLSGGVAYEPALADRVADNCAVVRLVRDTQGNVDQPTWYHVLGVLAFCDDGDVVAHDWSRGHPNYTPRETDAKLAQVRAKQTGATSCAKLGEHQPALCATCPLSGQIKSPISTGRSARRQVAPIPASPSTGSSHKIPGFPGYFGMHKDPRTGKDVIVTYPRVPDPNAPGKLINGDPIIVTRSMFYPVSRIDNHGEAAVEFERVLPQNQGHRRFVLTGAMIGKGKDSWAGVLGQNEIVTEGPQGGSHMDSLLKQWMHQLSERARMVNTYDGFGWADAKQFVLGEEIMSPGRVDRAIISGDACAKLASYTPAGDLQTWVDLIDRAYNAPGQEGYQFLVACGFAAPLVYMTDEMDGITVYAHSTASGVGKTTAAGAALSIWGNPKELRLSEGKATSNALWANMGISKSLPMLFDELTNMDPRVASQLVFSVSDGASRQRLNSASELKINNSRWRTIMLATGNNMLTEKLAAHRGNAEAEISRLFEFNLQATNHLTPNEAMDLFPKLNRHYGHAGRVFARHLVDNYDAIKARIEHVRRALNAVANVQQRERYWSSLMACALVGTEIAKNLGLVDFSLTGLKTWMIARLEENRVHRTALANDPLELVGYMLSELMPGVLVTIGEGNLHTSKPASVLVAPKQAIIGRAILPTPGSAQSPQLYISQKAVQKWAASKGVSGQELIVAAVAAGWAAGRPEKYSFGRGTVEYGAQTGYLNAIKLFPDVIGSASAGAKVVQQLSVVGSASNGGGRTV